MSVYKAVILVLFLALVILFIRSRQQKSPKTNPGYIYPDELTGLIVHLKESNYEVGIASVPPILRKKEERVLQMVVNGRNGTMYLYVTDVKNRVQ